MLWFEGDFGAKIGLKNDGFCPLKIAENIDDIVKKLERREKVDINFSGGRFVSLKNGLNYQKILNDFSNAKVVRVVTFNISKNEKNDKLIQSLHTLQENVDVQIITNIPSHFDGYFNSPAGEAMRKNFKNNCGIYLRKLDPENFESTVMTFLFLIITLK